MRWFSCFHTSFPLAPPPPKKTPKQTKKNLALTHNAIPAVQSEIQVQVAAPVACSLEQKMKRSGKAHFLLKLHLPMVVFYA